MIWKNEILGNGNVYVDEKKEIDVISAMDRSTVGIKEDWRSFYRSVVYYRHKCLIKGEEFVWKGMK